MWKSWESLLSFRQRRLVLVQKEEHTIPGMRVRFGVQTCIQTYQFLDFRRREDRTCELIDVVFGKSGKEAHMPLSSCKSGEEAGKSAHNVQPWYSGKEEEERTWSSWLSILENKRRSAHQKELVYFGKAEEEPT